MRNSQNKIDNRQLMDFPVDPRKPEEVLDFNSAISVNRPFCSRQEAGIAANAVNNVLAFVSYGVQNDAGFPHECEQVLQGMGTILDTCRLVSLRVEQYIDQLPEDETK